ncbi:MAG: gluconate 2-dehydrogenase subunit 3 family protein [Myxococcaceae bacterium]|nr:gluconate 2-dehydrogenase subunit 3 family protein [Myxococcaceae bacterium]
MGPHSPTSPTRRGVLKKGLFGGALLLLGSSGWLASRATKRVPLPEEGLKVLSPRQYAVLHALAEALIPASGAFPSAEKLRVAFEADRILERVDVTAQTEITALIGLFENALANAIFGQRLRPFTQLEPTEREKAALEWRDSRLAVRRTGFRALRGLLMAAYYGNPAVFAAIGYAGPPQGLHDAHAPVWKGGGTPRPKLWELSR